MSLVWKFQLRLSRWPVAFICLYAEEYWCWIFYAQVKKNEIGQQCYIGIQRFSSLLFFKWNVSAWLLLKFTLIRQLAFIFTQIDVDYGMFVYAVCVLCARTSIRTAAFKGTWNVIITGGDNMILRLKLRTNLTNWNEMTWLWLELNWLGVADSDTHAHISTAI